MLKKISENKKKKMCIAAALLLATLLVYMSTTHAELMSEKEVSALKLSQSGESKVTLSWNEKEHADGYYVYRQIEYNKKIKKGKKKTVRYYKLQKKIEVEKPQEPETPEENTPENPDGEIVNPVVAKTVDGGIFSPKKIEVTLFAKTEKSNKYKVVAYQNLENGKKRLSKAKTKKIYVNSLIKKERPSVETKYTSYNLDSEKVTTRVEWAPVEGATGYQVLINKTSKGTIKYAKKKRYLKNSATIKESNGKLYINFMKKDEEAARNYYSVRAYKVCNGKFVYSKRSTLKEAKYLLVDRKAPKNFNLKVEDGNVTLSWNDSSKGYAHYQLQRKKNNGKFIMINDYIKGSEKNTKCEYNDSVSSSKEKDTTYTYRVRRVCIDNKNAIGYFSSEKKAYFEATPPKEDSGNIEEKPDTPEKPETPEEPENKEDKEDPENKEDKKEEEKPVTPPEELTEAERVMGKVTGIKAIQTGHTSVKIVWDGAENATRFNIRLDDEDLGDFTNEYSYEYHNLNPGEKYTISLCGYSNNLKGYYGLRTSIEFEVKDYIYTNDKIYLNYSKNGSDDKIKLFLGQDFTDELNAKINQGEAISYTSKRDYCYVYCYDTEDFDNFLAVYVAEDPETGKLKVIGWLTNAKEKTVFEEKPDLNEIYTSNPNYKKYENTSKRTFFGNYIEETSLSNSYIHYTSTNTKQIQTEEGQRGEETYAEHLVNAIRYCYGRNILIHNEEVYKFYGYLEEDGERKYEGYYGTKAWAQKIADLNEGKVILCPPAHSVTQLFGIGSDKYSDIMLDHTKTVFPVMFCQNYHGGTYTAEGVINSFYNSDMHKISMLNPNDKIDLKYICVGVGVSLVDGYLSVDWIQDFYTPRDLKRFPIKE